jgi:hypothetical protein
LCGQSQLMVDGLCTDWQPQYCAAE